MSKYKKIASEIANEIKEGKYCDTNKLPTEEELSERYDVSRTTVRKSISLLTTKGLVYQVQGSGVFVRESAFKNYVSLEELKGLTRDFPDSKIKSEVIKIEVIKSDEKISKKMKCEVGTNLYYIKRLRYKEDIPYAIEKTYFNKNIVPYLSEEIAKNSIYSYILEDLKLSIGFADKLIYADKLNKENAQLLNLDENDPALIIESVVFLSNGEIFEISEVIHNYKETKLLKLANF